jgi:hypothetical protein
MVTDQDFELTLIQPFQRTDGPEEGVELRGEAWVWRHKRHRQPLVDQIFGDGLPLDMTNRVQNEGGFAEWPMGIGQEICR